jgi:hypothetical protein
VPAQARVPLGHKPDKRLRRDRRVFHRIQSKIIIDVKHKRLCSCVQFPGIPKSVSRSRERQPPHRRTHLRSGKSLPMWSPSPKQDARQREIRSEQWRGHADGGSELSAKARPCGEGSYKSAEREAGRE